MATYTVTLSRSNTAFATYYASSLSYSTSSGWSTYFITKPSWNSGRKRFNGYNLSSGVQIIGPSGSLSYTGSISENKSATEQWTTLAPALMVKSNGSYIGELVYDGGVWYSDYANRVAFDSGHPMAVPTRECLYAPARLLLRPIFTLLSVFMPLTSSAHDERGRDPAL